MPKRNRMDGADISAIIECMTGQESNMTAPSAPSASHLPAPALSTKVRDELATLEVYGDTAVGWDAHTPVNETVDENGNPFPTERSFGVPDPRAPARRVYDDPSVVALREHLRSHNGLRGLEICAPDEVQRAARIFHRDGFVVVRDLLDEEHLRLFRQGSAEALRQILEVPGAGERKYMTESGRLPHRYSYGTSSASRQMLHEAAWAAMIDLPTTTPILAEIFGSMEYLVLGAGGDLCLPGAVEYQHLHADVGESQHMPEHRLATAEAIGVEIRRDENTGELEAATRRRIIDYTPPVVTINFAMCDLTPENGPIRQIPGSHTWQMRPVPPEDEPEWMRLCTLVGAPAGAGVFRDNRAWHGATPNVSREIRSLPNVEYGAPWLRGPHKKTMPHAIWETLSPHAKHLCRRIKAEPGEWPAGAGVMHPLGSERRAAAARMGGSGERQAGSPGG